MPSHPDTLMASVRATPPLGTLADVAVPDHLWRLFEQLGGLSVCLEGCDPTVSRLDGAAAREPRLEGFRVETSHYDVAHTNRRCLVVCDLRPAGSVNGQTG